MAEEMVSIYDPIVDAYREVPISRAEKFIANHDEIVAKVAVAKEDAEIKAEVKKIRDKK